MAREEMLTPDVRREAERRLDEIEAKHGVSIFLAVESGSRAWGFPSPDSDFDVRFLYVRPVRDYLALDAPRDVIETPIDGDWDVNGWDLRKALLLLRKGNAVVSEWLSSPLVYREEGPIAVRLRALVQDLADPNEAIRHYHGLLGSQFGRDIQPRAKVRLKKYFYSIRSAASLEWLRLHGTIPPMSLPALLEGGCVPADARKTLNDLLEQKLLSHELGEGPRIPELDDFILASRAWAESTGAIKPHRPTAALKAAADQLFLDAVAVRDSGAT